MTEDHPEAVELLQFFVQGPWGRLSLCKRPSGLNPSTAALAFVDLQWIAVGLDGHCEPLIADAFVSRFEDRKSLWGDPRLRGVLEKLPLDAEAAILFVDAALNPTVSR